MGWWRTGDGEDVIGDGPADTIQGALKGIVQSRESKPTPKMLLEAMLRVLNSKWVNGFLAEGPCRIATLEARVRTLDDTHYVIRVDAVDADDPTLTTPLREAFRNIVTEYQDVVERAPRLSEVLHTVRFVLGYRPDEHLAEIDEDDSVESISAEVERQS